MGSMQIPLIASATKLRIIVEEDEFVISRSAATVSRTIRTMLKDDPADVITLPNIGSRTFPMIISYLEKHANVYLSDEESSNFDNEFASGMDINVLKKLMTDAYYLNIEGLKRVLAPKLADMLDIQSEKSSSKFERDLIQSPGWKEQTVQDMMEMNWARVDLQMRCRKLLEQAKNLQ